MHRGFWDHPRVGGEKLYYSFQHERRVGSPPRGRGKVICAGLGPVSRRITPAWAGKRELVAEYLRLREDHPRVGGEKSIRILRMWERTGSPPRGRGKD